MNRQIKEDFKGNAQTRYFYLNWLIYFVAILASTIYCYGRLNYVRSYPTSHQSTETQKP